MARTIDIALDNIFLEIKEIKEKVKTLETRRTMNDVRMEELKPIITKCGGWANFLHLVKKLPE